MFQFKKTVLLPLAALGFAVSIPASASTVSYTDRVDFENHLSTEHVIDFDTPSAGYIPPAAGQVLNVGASGLPINGVTFLAYRTNLAYGLTVVNANASQPWYNWGSGVVVRGDDGVNGTVNRIHIAFSSPVTAWGSDLMTGNNNNSVITFRVNDAPIIETATTFTRPTRAFFGMTSDAPISSVDMYFANDTYPMFDNFTYGVAGSTVVTGGGGGTGSDPGETPEAASLLLAATGLFFIVRSRKYFSPQPTAA